MHLRAVALSLLALTGSAAAAPRLERVVVVGRSDAGQPWTDAATDAKLGADAELSLVILAKDGDHRVVYADDAVAPLRLGGRAIAARDRRPIGDLGTVRVQWSTVEPHGFRTDDAAANGATTPYYSNVSTEYKDFGRWLGYDHIDYFETVVAAYSDDAAARRIPAAVTSAEPDAMQVPSLGTTRYKVEVEVGATHLASPGAESTDALGLTRAVHRVSVRDGDDFMGWLSAYLLVPEVFGSAGDIHGANHQTERFTGADCADVMVGAMRRAGHKLSYTNVAGLTSYARVIAKPTVLDDHGMPATPITGIQRGDLVRIDYGGQYAGYTPRSWDHVAAIWQDRSDPKGPHKGGADGQLDGWDLVIHMGHPRLLIEPLSDQSPATVDVLRWKK